MQFSIPFLLSLIIFLPLVGAVAVLLVPGDQIKKYVALATTLLTFLISLVLLVGWQNGEAALSALTSVISEGKTFNQNLHLYLPTMVYGFPNNTGWACFDRTNNPISKAH